MNDLPNQNYEHLNVKQVDSVVIVHFQSSELNERNLNDAIDEELGQMIEDGARSLLLDFSNVTLISKRTFVPLVNSHRALQRAGGQLVVTNLAPPIAEVFEVLKMTKYLTIAESTEEGIALLK